MNPTAYQEAPGESPADEGTRLEAELVEALMSAQAPEAADAALAARVKRRVLQRIAETEVGHLTVQATEGAWQPFGDGVQIKVLHEAGGVMSYLLKLEAGATIGAHRHPHDEECVVLEGSLSIGEALVVHAGGFHLARRDALHGTLSTTTGATIFLRGAPPEIAQLI
jgi:quercetin dioxygenase-like cupin family protein